MEMTLADSGLGLAICYDISMICPSLFESMPQAMARRIEQKVQSSSDNTFQPPITDVPR